MIESSQWNMNSNPTNKFAKARDEQKTNLTRTGEMALGSHFGQNYQAQIQNNYNNSADTVIIKIQVHYIKFGNQRKLQPDMQNQLKLLKQKMNQNSIHQNEIDRQETNISYELNNLNARLQQKPTYHYQQQQELSNNHIVPRNRVYNQDTINNSQNSTNLTNFSEPQKDLASRINNKFNQYQYQQDQRQVYQPSVLKQQQTPIKNQIPQESYIINNQNRYQQYSQQPSMRDNSQRIQQYSAQQTLPAQNTDNYPNLRQYPSQQEAFRNQQYQYTQPKQNQIPQQQHYNSHHQEFKSTNEYAYRGEEKNNYAPLNNRNPPKTNLKSIDEIPAVAKQKPTIPAEILDSQNQELVECPEGCGRQFNEVAMQKHVKVCKKVFQSKRKEFNSKAHRQVAQEQAKLEKIGKSKDQQIQTKKQQGKQGKDPKWKKQSEQFRQMLSNIKNGATNQAQTSNAIEDDYVECPSCGRRFNEHAAARHIPSCQQRAKVNRFRGKK